VTVQEGHCNAAELKSIQCSPLSHQTYRLLERRVHQLGIGTIKGDSDVVVAGYPLARKDGLWHKNTPNAPRTMSAMV
jgi:hypothetical protein